LCKYGEGAGFPFQIESLEDGVDDDTALPRSPKSLRQMFVLM
jgi:hypothetical protein